MLQRVISEITQSRAMMAFGVTSVLVGYSATAVNSTAIDQILSNWQSSTLPLWRNVEWEIPETGAGDRVIAGRRGGYPSVDAIAAILSSKNPKFSRSKSRRLAHDILGLCQRYGFTPGFILGLIHVESNFDPKIESFAGAIGLMQVKPSTGKYMAKKLNLRWKGRETLENPHTNLQIGFAYLRQLRNRLPFRKQYVTAYNWGPTRIEKYVKKRKRLPLDYYKKVIRFGKRYAHLDQTSSLQ